VHATDPEVRFQLMRNKKSRLINDHLKFLYDNKISFHSQVVLCPDINDKKVLEKTIEDLARLYPYAKTLSIVPVGLTGYRDNLPILKHVDEKKAREVIVTVNHYREKLEAELGNPFVYVSDEFYSKANLDYPRYKQGEINAQKANGVGLFSDFLDEFEIAFERINGIEIKPRKVIIATGASAFAKIRECADILSDKVEGLIIETVKVINEHFGKSITVAGLLTGYDIIKAVANKKADILFVPESALRDGENVFLDGMTIEELKRQTGISIEISPNDGYEFAEAMIGGPLE
jgi:putative radical SAM enzyme (TIGR03279 family)